MARPDEFDTPRRHLFDLWADEYGDGRPGYPPLLAQRLVDRCGLGRGAAVLEIGPGAGQATQLLLDAGAEVVAVEPGTRFARRLIERFGDERLTVINADFEHAELPDEPADLVAAGTSFHWIEPSVGLELAAERLRPGGSLALWWNHYGDPGRADLFRTALQPTLRRHMVAFTDAVDGGAAIGAHPYALDAVARIEEIAASGRFGPVTHELIPWTMHQTAAEARTFFSSFSQWMAMDDHVRAVLLDHVERLVIEEFGGSVSRPCLTAVFTTQRR